MNDASNFHPSRATIAGRLQLTVSAVSKAFKILEAQQILVMAGWEAGRKRYALHPSVLTAPASKPDVMAAPASEPDVMVSPKTKEAILAEWQLLPDEQAIVDSIPASAAAKKTLSRDLVRIRKHGDPARRHHDIQDAIQHARAKQEAANVG